MRLATIVSIGLTVASPARPCMAQADANDLLLGRAVRLASHLQQQVTDLRAENDRLRGQSDSLRARVAVLTFAIRETQMAAAQYNLALQVAQGQVNWYRALPDQCVQ